MRNNNRKHYDRITNKVYTNPYRHKRKTERKPAYVSKAYKEYQRYIRYRYDSLGPLFSESVYTEIQRIGYMRRLLGQKQPPIVHTSKYLAYMEEVKVYSRHFAYTVPKVWTTWDEDQALLLVKQAREN